MNLRLRADRLSGRTSEPFSLELSAGEVGIVLGEGAPSAFRVVSGADPAAGGALFFEGKEVTRWPTFQRSRAGMSFLGERSSLVDRLTVRENVVMALGAVQRRAAEADKLLEQLGLSASAGAVPSSLATIDRRRLELARAMVLNPKLLIWDRPNVGLEDLQMISLIASLRKYTETGMSALLMVIGALPEGRPQDRVVVVENTKI